jgi:tRNA threonylcarbamoyladenosine biosynthesis protein TsaE
MTTAPVGVLCPQVADTQALAGRVAAHLKPGDLLVLAGGLGAGKTAFAAGLAAGLGVEERVTSPTFVLMRHYTSGFMPLTHVDVYRLGSLHEFDDLDVYELSRDGVLVVEWGDAVEGALPEDHLRVEFEVAEDGSRTITFRPAGAWQSRPLEVLA